VLQIVILAATVTGCAQSEGSVASNTQITARLVQLLFNNVCLTLKPLLRLNAQVGLGTVATPSFLRTPEAERE
jgi:hypothetical protein